jgi:hypothetical protein
MGSLLLARGRGIGKEAGGKAVSLTVC